MIEKWFLKCKVPLTDSLLLWHSKLYGGIDWIVFTLFRNEYYFDKFSKFNSVLIQINQIYILKLSLLNTVPELFLSFRIKLYLLSYVVCVFLMCMGFLPPIIYFSLRKRQTHTCKPYISILHTVDQARESLAKCLPSLWSRHSFIARDSLIFSITTCNPITKSRIHFLYSILSSKEKYLRDRKYINNTYAS